MTLLLAKLLRYLLENAFGTGMLTSITNLTSKMMKMYQDLMTGTSGASGGAEALYKTFSSIGIALLVIYTIVNVYETMQSQDGSWTIEGIVRTFVGFLIGFAFIKNGWIIMGGFARIGNAFVTSLMDVQMTSRAAFTSVQVETLCSTASMYLAATKPTGLIRALFLIGIPCLIVFISNLVINIIIVERFIELVARVVVSPIALAGSFGRGVFSHGIQYIKKLATLSIQAAVSVIIVWAGTSIMGKMANDTTSILGGPAVALEETTEYLAEQSVAGMIAEEAITAIYKPQIWITEAVLPYIIGQEQANAVFDFASGAIRAASTFFFDEKESQEESGTETPTTPTGTEEEEILDDEDSEILTGMQTIGKHVLYGNNETGSSGILDFSSMIFVCAMQVGLLFAVVRSQSLAADIIG